MSDCWTGLRPARLAPAGSQTEKGTALRLFESRARPLAVVSGGRRGVGARIAVELAAQGFDLALADVDCHGAESTVADITALGARTTLYRLDPANVGDHAGLVERIVSTSGPITCLVNNAGAGTARCGDLLDVSAESYDRVLDVNLRGTFFFTQAVARHMAATPAEMARSIITVSSPRPLASIEQGEHCISRAGLSALNKLFARRLALLGIGVFEVRPDGVSMPTAESAPRGDHTCLCDSPGLGARYACLPDLERAVAALAAGQLALASGSVINVDSSLSTPRP